MTRPPVDLSKQKRFLDKTYVQTPQEVIDFLHASVNELCKENFGHGVDHKDVAIVDPFAGKGEFFINTPKFKKAKVYCIEQDPDRAAACRDNLGDKAKVICADTMLLLGKSGNVCIDNILDVLQDVDLDELHRREKA